MKRFRSISIIALLGAAAFASVGCGSTMRDWFYANRQPGYTPARDTDASAAVFRNDTSPRQTQP
ncbi:MAG: hypothetical protein KDA31_11985 [Phycisphaerales bacterium]|nr:hypothetical protein [Phycisphaerales bacterium]MCB9836651.1 hypothetical protein [Phycisphaera sp.]